MTTGISENQRAFSAQFNDKEYSFFIALFHPAYNSVIPLNKSAMIYLEIVDSVFNPFHTATILISDQTEVLMKGVLPYRFIGDGRDIVNIEIINISKGEFDKDSNDEKNKEFMGMNFKFVAISCEDVVYNSVKCKRIELIEYAQYALSESIYNTFQGDKAPTGSESKIELGNSDRYKQTGEIIEGIINTSFGKNSDNFAKDSNGKSLMDDGHTGSKVSIDVYGTLSNMEVLNYALSFHIGTDGTPCILHFDRYQQKFVLISLKKLFSEHNQRLIEVLTFSDQGVSDGTPIVWRTNHTLRFSESLIEEFYDQPASAKYNISHAANGVILTTSRAFKSMIFDITTLEDSAIREQFRDIFVTPFDGLFENKIDINFPKLFNKTDSYKSYKNVLSPLLAENQFKSQKLQSLLFLKNSYMFKMRGLMSRQSMSFVDVTKTPNIDSSRWDMETLGRHFVTSITHSFTQNSYTNTIETVKPYSIIDERNAPVEIGTK